MVQRGVSETARAWREKLEARVAKQRQEALDKLTAASAQRCKEIVNELVDEFLKSPLVDGAFSLPQNPDWVKKFAAACAKVISEYQARTSGPSKTLIAAATLPKTMLRLWTRIAELVDTYHIKANERLEKDNERLKEESASQVATIKELECNLAACRADFQNAQQRIGQPESDASIAQQRIHDSEMKNAELNAAIQVRDRDIRRLEDDLERSKAATMRASKRLDELQASSSETMRAMKEKQKKAMADLEAFAKLVEDSYAREAAMMERGANERARAAAAAKQLKAQVDMERSDARQAREASWIRECLSDVVHEVEMQAQQRESSKHTVRLIEEKRAIQERLADFFLRASTLPPRPTRQLSFARKPDSYPTGK